MRITLPILLPKAAWAPDGNLVLDYVPDTSGLYVLAVKVETPNGLLYGRIRHRCDGYIADDPWRHRGDRGYDRAQQLELAGIC